MRYGSFLLALGIVGLGAVLAWQFRPAPVEPAPAQLEFTQPLVSSRNSPRATAIVPLSIGADSSAGDASEVFALPEETPAFVHSIPAIRRPSTSALNDAAPKLTPSYQRPLAILGLATTRQEIEKARAEAPTPITTDSTSETHAVAKPVTVQHIIADGDTLAGLAERYLGDEHRAMEIFSANSHVLDDPQLLPIGATIDIAVD